jgi:hypothetical protein
MISSRKSRKRRNCKPERDSGRLTPERPAGCGNSPEFFYAYLKIKIYRE